MSTFCIVCCVFVFSDHRINVFSHFVHHVLLRGCSFAAKSSCDGGPISYDGEDGRMDEYESEDAQIGVDEDTVKEHCDACISSMPRLWRSDGRDCACTKMLVSSKCAQQVQFAVSLQYSIRLVCVPSLCMVASAWNAVHS